MGYQRKKDGVPFPVTCIPWIIVGGLLAEKWMIPSFLHYFSIGVVAIAFCANIFFARDNRKPQFESRHGDENLSKARRIMAITVFSHVGLERQRIPA